MLLLIDVITHVVTYWGY